MSEPNQKDPERVNRARRRLLSMTAYVPPIVLGIVALQQGGCQPTTSCAPGSCAPTTQPCSPDSNPCSPNMGCNPSTCNPNA
jgi:hypothetical protein